ncbi:MAG: isoprenylcysteine carboxylmethyltransferase family protein [Bacteroidota bacterium]|nr:isoprenylcysteine carboxylmethyltransferase family protein [Bacteroidota bacterium]
MDIRQKIFEVRSYTPLPFLIAIVMYAHPTVASLVVGFVFAACGEAVRLWSVSIAGSETRTTGPVGGTHLVTEGPFSHVRNPLYVGNIFLYVGFGIMSNALIPWLQLGAVIFFFLQYSLIVSKEEEHLRSAFGEEYRRYMEAVPRFLPRLKRYTGEHSFHREADLSRGVQSERRTLQAFMLVIAVLLVEFFIENPFGTPH